MYKLYCTIQVPYGPRGPDRDSRLSEKSLSDDAMALHHSIDHFALAFGTETVFKETGIAIGIESQRLSEVNWVYPEGLDQIGGGTEGTEGTESNCDTEEVSEPLLIELEEGLEGDSYGDIYRNHVDAGSFLTALAIPYRRLYYVCCYYL